MRKSTVSVTIDSPSHPVVPDGLRESSESKPANKIYGEEREVYCFFLYIFRYCDIDAFFPSPEKLLLAEKHFLESEIKGMIDQERRIISLWPQELSQRFNSCSDTWENYYASSSYQTAP